MDRTTKGIIVTSVLVILIGLFFMGIGYHFYSTAQNQIENGQKIDATIEDTWVERDVTGTGDDRRITYYPRVNYSYTINGTVYYSTSIYAGAEQGENTRGEAEDVIASYQAGNQRQAYYMPSEPSSAFLEDEAAVVLPLFFMFSGLAVILVFGWRMLNRLV